MIISTFRHMGDRTFVGVLASNENKDISVIVLMKIINNEHNIVQLLEADTQKMTDSELIRWVDANILVITEELTKGQEGE